MLDAVHKSALVELLPRLRRFAGALSGSRDEGDDLVQAACVKLLSRPLDLPGGDEFRAYLYRVIRNLWIDRIRAGKRANTVPEDAAAELPDDRPARAAEARLDLEIVRRAVGTLSPEQREVLLLVCVEGQSYRETAETLDLPIGTVMSRLSRARAAIDRIIGPNQGES